MCSAALRQAVEGFFSSWLQEEEEKPDLAAVKGRGMGHVPFLMSLLNLVHFHTGCENEQD